MRTGTGRGKERGLGFGCWNSGLDFENEMGTEERRRGSRFEFRASFSAFLGFPALRAG